MEKHSNGSFIINLNGLCYREMNAMAEMLKELSDRGHYNGVKFDLESLQCGYDSMSDEIFLFDDYGNSTLEDEIE